MPAFPTPTARLALNRIAAAPVITRERHRKAYTVTADEWFRYTGPDAALLQREYDAALDEAIRTDRAAAVQIMEATPISLIEAALAARTDGYVVRQTLVGDWGRNTGTVEQWEVAPALATDCVTQRRAA